MQLARGFFLTPEKRVKRKIIEIAITFQLENRFNKQQIFQIYANEIPLGQQGSFAINGFGQAAQTYFGKDVKQLDLAQCAMLAGMIQHPSYLNPIAIRTGSMQRRNMVLDAMVETGKITKQESIQAKAEPLNLASINIDAGEAPYFRRPGARPAGAAPGGHGFQPFRSAHLHLARSGSAAGGAEAVTQGMKGSTRRWSAACAPVKAGDDSPINYPQVALVALNPHTGQVLALVGGRNYGASQFDHAVRYRPTGSAFKPFVYAAAFNTSLAGTVLTQPAWTPRQREEPARNQLVSADPAPPDPGRQSGSLPPSPCSTTI
jgi:penicillin-binding protein 1B